MPRIRQPSAIGVITIYRIKNSLNEKCYIGRTMWPDTRFSQHKNRALHGCPHLLHAAMRKYDSSNFTMVPIATAENDAEAYVLERKFIKQEGTYGHGYNMTEGGETPDAEFCRKAATEIWSRSEFRELRRKLAAYRRRSKAASIAAREIWSRPEFRETRKRAAIVRAQSSG